MSSIQDVYQAIVTATQALSKFTATFPRTGGSLTVINNLSSGAFVTILPANPNRNSVSFHNPAPGSSGPTAYIGPLTQGPNSSASFAPNPNQLALGGLMEVIPGDWLTLNGGVTQGYQAIVTAGSSQALTVMDQ